MELVNLYVKLKIAGALPKDLEEGLARSLKLGGFLAEARHFEADFNHGFNEGAALLLLADNFPHMPGAAGWRTLALERLKAMLVNTIDADGVEVENSPLYQVYVLGLVYQIAQWAGRYEPTLAAPYSEAAAKMLRYTAEITQPNGYLPMLGANGGYFSFGLGDLGRVAEHLRRRFGVGRGQRRLVAPGPLRDLVDEAEHVHLVEGRVLDLDPSASIVLTSIALRRSSASVRQPAAPGMWGKLSASSAARRPG